MTGEPVTVRRLGEPTGGYDSQGNPELSPATEFVSEGWAVAPRAAAETSEPFGQQILDGLTLYRNEPFTALPTDLFQVRGEWWEVDGDPGLWVNPFDTVPRGVVVNLARSG